MKIRIRLCLECRGDLLRLGLTLALVAGLLAAVALTHRSTQASPGPELVAAASATLPQYYLTASTHYGNHAADAGVCAAGYHFASLWEIAQTSTLRYNTTLGFVSASMDQGQGPSQTAGWVRTGGGAANANTDPPGTANCSNWTTSGFGTLAAPLGDWTASSMLGWKVSRSNCNAAARVWCREDAQAYVYLPAVQK
jgi:hypothetical protein